MPSDSEGSGEASGVWVYVEHEAGEIKRTSLEALAAGRKIADRLGQELVAVMLGNALGELVKKPIEYGADRVIYADDERLKDYLCLPYTSALYSMVKSEKPYAMIFVADDVGRDLAPRLAYRLKTGLATDNIELDVEDYYHAVTKTTYKDLLIQIRPDFATRVAKIYTPRHRPQMATIRPGNFRPAERDPNRRGRVERFTPTFLTDDFRVVLQEIRELPKSGVNLEDADCIVSIGLGILRDGKGNPRNPREGYQLARQLADAIAQRWGMKVEIGASRALIYAQLKELEGLITQERQVGQTGKTVSPEVYFALGISGSVQHRVGMQRSKRIVAVNLDPSAPIFEIAHYPIVGDLYEVVPRLIEEIRGH